VHHRSLEEQAVLQAVVRGEVIESNSLVVDLQQRGILTDNQALFSASFQRFLLDKG